MELEGVEDKLLYKKGLNKELDRKFAQYKKKNIWAGDGHLGALTDIEDFRQAVEERKDDPWENSNPGGDKVGGLHKKNRCLPQDC